MAIPDRSGLIDRLSEVADRIGRSASLDLIVLYGSAAARERRPPPEDLDIAVRGSRVLDLVALTNRFIQATRMQGIDLVDLRRADPVLLALVARDGVALYEAELGSFVRFASLAARRFADTRKFREAERQEMKEFLRTRTAE